MWRDVFRRVSWYALGLLEAFGVLRGLRSDVLGMPLLPLYTWGAGLHEGVLVG